MAASTIWGWLIRRAKTRSACVFLALVCFGWNCSASKAWGDLETEAILLEPPDENISNKRFAPDKLDWFVPAEVRTNFVEQLNSFDLSHNQRAILQDVAQWRAVTNGFKFSPSRDFLLEISPLGRAQIYLWLGHYPENIYQNHPFILQEGDVDVSLANSGLADETRNTLKRLVYKRGPCWCFSDVAVFGSLSNDEYKRLLKTLTRVSAVLLKLRISPAADVAGLIRYWGRGGGEKNVKMLLESLAKVPGGATLDITHLLPAFARERLYRFPEKSQAELADRQQCFWTALNFFSHQPDDRFAKTAAIQETLQNDYVRVSDDAVFGDLIALADDSGQIVHCSVYIADQIVFTKNGGSILKPWILMPLPNMETMYAAVGARQTITLRSKQSALPDQ